jgi:hypothetical protein
MAPIYVSSGPAVGWGLLAYRLGGDHMKRMMRTQLFGGPERARKTKERIARAQLLVVAAREQAVETAQCGSLPPRKWRFTEAQRRRLAQLRSL